MKLRLPKTLTAALIAAFTVTGTYATTTKTTTYTDQATQVQTVFNGDIWTWGNQNGTAVSKPAVTFTNYETGNTYAGNANMTTLGGPDAFWKSIQDGSETGYVGNTFRFSGGSGNLQMNTDYSSWVWIGGLISEVGNSGTYTIGRDSSDIRLKGLHDVNMIIKSNVTVKSGKDRSTEIMTGGTWDVAEGALLTFSGKSLTHYTGQTVKITGKGTVKFDTPYTGQAGALFNVGEGATLTFAQAAQLGGTITNAGTVNFGGAVSLTSSLDGFESVASGHYVDSKGVESQNGFYAGSTEYTIVKGGGYTGLATVSHGGTQHTVTNGKITIGSAGGTDWTTYHLNVENASVDLSEAIAYAQTEGSTTLEEVIAKKSGAVVAVDSALSLNTLTVSAGADATINGGGSLAVSGGVEIVNGGSLTVDQGTTLKVSDAAAAKALIRGTSVTNNGTFEITGNVSLGNNENSVMRGTLAISNNAVLSLGSGDSQTVGISSFDKVVLNGGTVKVQSQANTINNVTVTPGTTGELLIIDLNNPSGTTVPTYQMAGVTSVGAGGTLIVANWWNAQANIAALVGEGTLKVTGNNGNTNVSPQTGSNEQLVLSIGSLSTENASFSGDLIIDHIPGGNDKKDSYTINTGSRAVTLKSFSVNYNMNRAAQALEFNLGADTTITGLMTLTSGDVNTTGTGNLTVGGLTGSGNLTVGDRTLTLNVTEGAHAYTGTLSIGGQLVKTGAGAQTLSGFAINETMLVEGGTLTLNGTYTLDGLADDAGRTYTFQDENGGEAAEEVGGFRITNGTKTVYTETSGTVSRAEGTKFQLDGKDVEVDANGVYKFPTSADKTTLWVNGSTPLSYDTYYAASGETPALTTAQVAGGATLAIGTNAVGTLAFQENGTTINLSGSGTVNAISGTGTLNLNGTVTLSSALTVGNGETFATSGTGSLNAGQLNANGGTTTFDTAASITRLIVNGSAAATVGGSGAIAVTSTTQDQGVEIGVGKTLTLLSENMNVAGTIHNNGNLIVGDGTNPALVKAVYFVNGNNNGGSSSFDIKANATLVATGADTNNSHASGWVMGEWNNSTTGKVAGTLLAQNASIWGCDSAYTLNIENGGLVATKGVRAKKDNQAYTVNLKEGGTLVLGGTSTPGATVLNATAGSTIGTYATSGVDYSGAIATTAVDGKAVTFDTSLYTFNEAGTAITKGDTAGELTISGAITGTAAVAKAGAGTLVLTGANTYSGGTTVNAGTLKAGSLGTGDITVNGGTLELTSSISTQGNLSITGGTLVFAGADMLTAGSLAVSGTVTFDLTNVAATKAGTVTLATATGVATGDFSGVTVNWALPESFSHGAVYVKDHSWVIDLISMGQALTWAGGTGNWSYDEADTSWLTPGDEPTPTHFTDKDSAVFTAAVDPALANIKEAISTAGVEVQAGADVTLQAAIGAETASLTPIELDIAGRLSTSVDVAATVVEATGADASWNITGGTVTADSISVAQDGKLALSGTGMTAETVSGPGTVVVGDGFTLTLGQQIDSDQATDLAILNNGTVAVALGSSQNVINMDAASTGTLEVTAGTISSQSALGANQTLQLNGGTIFAVKGGETAFASDIALAGNASMQLKDSANATFAGAVSGSGKTLSVSGGAANQTITFTDTVTLGGLNVAGSGETIVFKGSGSNLGAIYAQSGAFTIQFSKEDGADSAAYTIGTFAMSPVSSTGNRWLIVDQGVTVHATGSSLDPGASISSGWGVNNGGLLVNGILTTDGAIGLEANQQTAYIKGSGIINTAGLNFCNGSHTYIQDGITINITSNRGIFARNDNAAAGDVHLKNATLQAKDADWEFKVGRAADPVTLEDATTGTTFEAADGRTITITKVLGGTGKLVKAGEGVVKLQGANTYSGGTAVNAGTLEVAGSGSLGTGAIAIAEEATLQFDGAYTIANSVSGAGTIAYNGTTAATINFGDKNISGWTGSFDNVSSQAVTLTINTTGLNMDITHTGTGLVNLSLGVDNIRFAGEQLVNNVAHNTYWSSYITATGDVTATGKVVTGRLVLGEAQADADAVFTLSGADAQLYNNNGTEHKYTAVVQGYGTFAVVNGATQTLTKLNNSGQQFHGTLMAEGTGSILTIDSALASDVILRATDGGMIVLTSQVQVKEAAVDGGTFDLDATVETLEVTGEDSTLNIGTGSVENISLGGNLTANGDLTIFSGTEGTKVTAEAGKTMAVNGTANVDGRVEFHASETQDVKIAATRVEESEQYALESGNFDVTADTVEKVASGKVEVANQVSAREVVNEVAEGTLSLTAGVNMEALKNVIAASGDIEFLNVDAETQARLDSLDIEEGKTVSFSTGETVGDVTTEATVTVAGTLTAGTGATLNANLVMDGTEDSPAVLDVHAMGGFGGLNMGSNVTLAQGQVALSQQDLDAVTNLQFKDKYDLFNGVEDFYVGVLRYGDTDVWVNAKDVFSNLASADKDYYLFFSGMNTAGGKGDNVGTIYIMQIPEPTTGTLSLLALCALAARRRRK